jgi:hypothetical protein
MTHLRNPLCAMDCCIIHYKDRLWLRPSTIQRKQLLDKILKDSTVRRTLKYTCKNKSHLRRMLARSDISAFAGIGQLRWESLREEPNRSAGTQRVSRSQTRLRKQSALARTSKCYTGMSLADRHSGPSLLYEFSSWSNRLKLVLFLCLTLSPAPRIPSAESPSSRTDMTRAFSASIHVRHLA